MAAQTPVPGCVHHNGKVYVYVCNSCDKTLICNRCILDHHKGHDCELLEDLVSTKKQELKQYIDEVSHTDNPSLNRDLAITEEKIKENQKTFKNIIADVKAQANKLKRNVDKCADKLVTLCSELEKCNEDLLKSYKSALENLRDQNTRIVEDCEEIIKSGTNMEVIEKVKETRSKHDIPLEPNIKTVQFCQGPVLTSQLEHLLEFLTVDGQDQRYRSMTKPRVVSKFTHKSHVNVCRVTQDSAWLSYWDEDIYRVDQTGSVRETIQCKVKVTNITISPTTGRVWFCCKEDNTVREVMDSNTIVTRFVADSRPGSLCITDNNTIVVGMKGKIQMCTTDGQEVESAGAGGPCRQKVVWPHHLAYSTQTGDVAVSDTDGVSDDNYIAGKKPGKHPHIKVMDKHLNVRFRYPHQDTSGISTADDRNPGDTGPSLFYPYDVCFDLTGNVLVTECVTKSIILIDGVRGDYLYTIYKDDITQWSISLQTDGTLWVGLANKTVKILKYQP